MATGSRESAEHQRLRHQSAMLLRRGNESASRPFDADAVRVTAAVSGLPPQPPPLDVICRRYTNVIRQNLAAPGVGSRSVAAAFTPASLQNLFIYLFLRGVFP